MKWRGTQSESRRRYLQKFDAEEVERYESWILQLTEKDDEACLLDISRVFQFQPGMSVLDVGAGTGALCQTLSHIGELSLTALEPSPFMTEKINSKAKLSDVEVIEGFCDSNDDSRLFGESSFDVIVSRQLVNGLFDPLTAFRNWHSWLKTGGTVLVIDGLYDRSAWTGKWQEEVDILPLSACRSLSTTPYLLEVAGFNINAAQYMESTNSMPATQTQRYIVAATKPG